MLGVAAPIAINKTNKVEAAYDKTEMRSFVRSTLSKNKVRGTVVIVKDGQPQQISYGYGYYGRRLGAGNTKVVYPICSLQKVITGAIITQLIYAKKFDQNTKISKWYPNLKNANNITVGNLLTHTSGIVTTGTEVNRGRVVSEQSAIDWVVNKINSDKQGTAGNYYYNNANYILLAGIIRQETGDSYANAVNNRVIKPLGLQRTFFYEDIPFKTKTDAISYTYNYSTNKNYKNAEYVKQSLASQLPGAGNLFSVPMDYYRIQVGLTNGKILTEDEFKFLTNIQAKVTEYSGGLYIKNDGKLKMAYGNLYGTHFGNWFQMTTDNKDGMIMFLNQNQNNESQNKAIGYEILNHVKANTFTEK
ncbi:serine hydrolase [Lactobacillus sp. LL6]|uniref:serine hydrolase domain-containing protein n=1 Tax=Lactobacillus sp. LL6 TaxID=2596827 RepID=UPI001F5BE693|nr:serine hydrolase [Lactobacillus sp. LL6]